MKKLIPVVILVFLFGCSDLAPLTADQKIAHQGFISGLGDVLSDLTNLDSSIASAVNPLHSTLGIGTSALEPEETNHLLECEFTGNLPDLSDGTLPEAVSANIEGANCPIKFTMNMKLSGSLESGQASISIVVDYSIVDPEYSTVRDVTAFHFEANYEVNGDMNGMKINMSLNGSITSTTYGQVSINGSMDGNFSTEGGSMNFQITFGFTDFTAKISGNASFNADGTETSEYFVNGEKVDETYFEI